MLVLTRRISEQLIIGENIVITIVRIDGGQVRVGIDAPREITVKRSELTTTSRDHSPGSSTFQMPVIHSQVRLN